MRDDSTMDEALEFLAPYGPDLSNGLTNHAPMAAEALCALGRAAAVMPWLDGYRKLLAPRPAPRQRIGHEDWRSALGRLDRFADWTAFFEAELQEAAWREVAARWTMNLAPAICASATHGVIRVGHAVRSLVQSESPVRIHELAEALGYWAACYQTLPTAPPRMSGGAAPPHEAIARVPVVPQEQRHFTGTIVSSLEALDEFPAFAPVIGMIDTTAPPAELLSDLTETFARVYLANVHDVLSTIVFIHGVTSVAAVRSILPVVDEAAARAAIRYGWQAGCALYTAFGTRPAPDGAIEPPRENRETLIDMAITNGDEHAIKFTEACLREHALNPSPAYLAAARNALDMLPSA
ncbi:MAG TPA: questin oxidase family protein [Candidatus Acidoferrales bacterium]|nr:questin oxidase family protein [Candidatus Acidoferrales bacterium]